MFLCIVYLQDNEDVMDCVTLLGESVSKLFSAASVVSATVVQICSFLNDVSKCFLLVIANSGCVP